MRPALSDSTLIDQGAHVLAEVEPERPSVSSGLSRVPVGLSPVPEDEAAGERDHRAGVPKAPGQVGTGAELGRGRADVGKGVGPANTAGHRGQGGSMIYDEVQDPKTLQVPNLGSLTFGEASPLAPLLRERETLAARLQQIQERARCRKAELEAEVEAARKGAQVTARSNPADVAQAQAVAATAPAVLQEIEAEAQASSDALRRRLAAVDRDVRRAITPMLQLLWGYNRTVADYVGEVNRMQRTDPSASHAEWMKANEILALLSVSSAYFQREFRRVAGRAYDGEYGPLF